MIAGKVDGKNVIAKWCNTELESEAIQTMLQLSQTGKPCNILRGDVREEDCYLTRSGMIKQRVNTHFDRKGNFVGLRC